MKKTMKKILCLALVLMMTLPFTAFPVNAASAYKTYDEVDDGELLYAVNFNGTSNFYSPSDGNSSSWNKTDRVISNDGRSVTVKYTDKCTTGSAASLNRARFCGSISKYKVNGKAYTIEFTIDSTVPVGVHFDGLTGFIINPAQNKTYIGRSDNMTLLAGGETYDGTGDREQTYAIELKGGDTLKTNYAGSYDVYAPEVYKLYVKQANGTWKLIREVGEDKSNYFDWTEGDEFFYLSINRYCRFDNWNQEAGDSDVTSTVSDMNIYKGIGHLDYYTPDTPDTPDVPASEAVDFTNVNLQAKRKVDGKIIDFGGDYSGDKAIDKKLHDSAPYYASAGDGNNVLTQSAYFDTDGKIAFKDTEDGKYYGIIVAELSKVTALDKFTVWSPNGSQGSYIDNIQYDIYYSIDGISFVHSGIEIDNAKTAHQPVPYNEFPGEVLQADIGVDGCVNRNEMNMQGITAKYIAIAVKQGVPYGSAYNQIVLWEITATGTSPDMYLESGASVRMDDPTGLRFTGMVSKSYVEGLKEEYQTDDVTLGMLITPTSYLNDVDFTKEALSGTNYDPAYLEIDAADETVKEDGDYYKIKCVIANIQNYDREFSAILYVKVDGEILAYSEYNEVFNSRSVAKVAEAAYYDLKDANDGVYTNEVTVEIAGVPTTKYSRYDTDQREVRYGFFGQGEQENLVP